MLIWASLGIATGVLLCVAAFALDWFGVRTMIEDDVRSALEDEHFDRDAWDAFSRRREDDWPFIRRDDPDIDVWDVFSAPPKTDPGTGQEDPDADVWDAFRGDDRA
jgi:hypothetical protein